MTNGSQTFIFLCFCKARCSHPTWVRYRAIKIDIIIIIIVVIIIIKLIECTSACTCILLQNPQRICQWLKTFSLYFTCGNTVQGKRRLRQSYFIELLIAFCSQKEKSCILQRNILER